MIIYAQDGVLLRNSEESNHSPVRVQNACGTVYVDYSTPSHRAWKRSASIFGIVWKAYTLAGNFIMQRDKINFKGAVHSRHLHSVLNDLVDRGEFVVRLQLVVLSVGVGKCLAVQVDCALERRLRRVHWVRVMSRIEEICNVVVFYVKNWESMEQELRLKAWPHHPKSTTVSVTRRGTLTMRMTWDGIEWEGNEAFEEATTAMARFVNELI